MPFLPTTATMTGGQPSADNLYLIKGQQIPSGTALTNPVPIKSTDATTTATLFVSGAAAGAYQGAINVQPGANAAIAGGVGDGITVRTIAGTAAGTVATTVEIGANAQGANHLYIAGLSGVGEVYDEVYNQPVALQPITLSSTNPLAAPDPANTGEIFRCVQAGVAASAAAAIGTAFQVPKSGWYCLQLEVALGNAPAPAAPDINVPIVAVAGIDIGETLSFTFAKGVVVEPYGTMEFVAQEFAAADIVVAGGNVIKQFVSQHLFTVGETYTFTLKSSSALWNIGTNGQIKAELIAMC